MEHEESPVLSMCLYLVCNNSQVISMYVAYCVC